MRFWPFQRETRADSSYTDALVAAITANAGGASTAYPTATAALEACAGLVGRAFASASIEGASDHVIEAVTPALLNLAGRALIRRGEILFAIDVFEGELHLRPVSSHDIDGDYSRWTYRLNLPGPSYQITRDRVDSTGVLHLMYGNDPEQPWRGVSPLGVARLAGRLSAETVAALADEASGPRGSFLPLPKTDGNDATIQNLKGDIKSARGGMLAVEGMSDQWQTDAPRANSGWESKRFGAAPPVGLVQVAQLASNEVFAACGLSGILFGERGDGAGRREAFRQALHSVIAPLGRIVQSELRFKLNSPGLTLNFDALFASDLSGRARAFQSMVGGGMDVSKAASLAGLMELE